MTEGLKYIVEWNGTITPPPSGVESCGNETKGKTMFGERRER